ncbi:unnamed protein product [Symbiodinium microadriaticum]|nr:unnamed protein product [Symbiodinium microadriaticum]
MGTHSGSTECSHCGSENAQEVTQSSPYIGYEFCLDCGHTSEQWCASGRLDVDDVNVRRESNDLEPITKEQLEKNYGKPYPDETHDTESTGPFLAIFICSPPRTDLATSSHPVENDDVEQAATIFHEREGLYPDQVLIVANGEHPDEGCYDLVAPAVIKSYNIDENGKVCENPDRVEQPNGVSPGDYELHGRIIETMLGERPFNVFLNLTWGWRNQYTENDEPELYFLQVGIPNLYGALLVVASGFSPEEDNSGQLVLYTSMSPEFTTMPFPAAWFIDATQVSLEYNSLEEAQAEWDKLEDGPVQIKHGSRELTVRKDQIEVRCIE